MSMVYEGFPRRPTDRSSRVWPKPKRCPICDPLAHNSRHHPEVGTPKEHRLILETPPWTSQKERRALKKMERSAVIAELKAYWKERDAAKPT